MTKREFAFKALRAYERHLGIPFGWWGTYRDFTNGGLRVLFGSTTWTLSARGKVISRYDSRAGAINRARRMK